jgi:hypothetical protein
MRERLKVKSVSIYLESNADNPEKSGCYIK